MLRRSFLKILAGTPVFFPWSANAQVLVSEKLSGDPGSIEEDLIYSPTHVDLAIDSARGIGIPKPSAEFAAELMRVSASYVGMTSSEHREEIIKWITLFRIPPLQENGSLQKFCAAGLSWASCQAYCNIDPGRRAYNEQSSQDVFYDTLSDINQFYFKPHCSVNMMMKDAQGRNTWKPSSVNPKPGWLVVYDWNQDGWPDHIGLVQQRDDNILFTIEFNTTSGRSGDQSNGGRVASRRRELKFIKGYIGWY